MSEILSLAAPRHETQHYENNKQLVEYLEQLLPDPMVAPEGHNEIAVSSYTLSDDTKVRVSKIGFYLNGSDTQPLELEVWHPFIDGSRDVELYSFGPDVSKKGVTYSATSSSFIETIVDGDGNRQIAAAAGYMALRNVNLARLFGAAPHVKRKERKALERALSLEMDNTRTERLATLLSRCNETNKDVAG